MVTLFWIGAARAGRADQAQAARGDGERGDRVAAGVDVHQHAAVAGHDDRVRAVQRPAVGAGGVGAGRGQRPVAGPGERLDRVAAGRVRHGVHRARGTRRVGGLGRAGEGRQPAGRGEPDGTCCRRADKARDRFALAHCSITQHGSPSMAACGSLRLVSSKFADSQGIHIVKLAKSYARQRALGGVTVDRGRHQGPFGRYSGVQAGPGTAWPGSTSITRMRYPARSAWSAVSPTAPAARAHCAGCPVRRECLAFGLRTHQVHGVWEGLSEQERYPLRSVTLADMECGQATKVDTVYAADLRDDHEHAGVVAAADHSPRSA